MTSEQTQISDIKLTLILYITYSKFTKIFENVVYPVIYLTELTGKGTINTCQIGQIIHLPGILFWHYLHTHLCQFLKALRVSLLPLHMRLFGKTPITIHDKGHMFGHRPCL